MTRNPLKDGNISENSFGIGTVTPRMLRGRAEELATLRGDWLPKVTAADLEEARLELTGDGDVAPEVAATESAAESERWDPVPGSTGQKTPLPPGDDEDEEGRSDNARLVAEGVAGAGADHRIQAARAAAASDGQTAPGRAPLGVALILSVLAGLSALTAGAADEKPGIEPHAGQLLKRMGDYLGKAAFFSVRAEIWQDVQLASGQRIQAGRTAELQVRRPDRMRTEVHSTRQDRTLIYDGSAITLFNRAHSFYGTVHASGSLDEAMDIASERFGIAMPLEDFIRSDPYKDLVQKVTSGLDLGAATVMGTACEHLAFTQGNIDWQIWIETGARPVPRKFIITYKDEPDAPQFTALFSNWDFATTLPDFVFTFDPPPGVAKIKVKEIKAANQASRTEPK